MNVPIGDAAKILGVSRSTLKRRASDWGLTTYWDCRGRRYAVHELEAAKNGALNPTAPATLNLDIDQITQFSVPNGYRFRVYKTKGAGKGYLGYYGGERYGDVLNILQNEHGGGTFHLKLLDPDGKMTGYNFTVNIDGPANQETQEIEVLGVMTKMMENETGQIKEKKTRD